MLNIKGNNEPFVKHKAAYDPGGNGTIGSVLAKELTLYTNRIRLVGRKPKKVNQTDELFRADLSDPAMVEKAVAGSEVVYLLVGFDY